MYSETRTMSMNIVLLREKYTSRGEILALFLSPPPCSARAADFQDEFFRFLFAHFLWPTTRARTRSRIRCIACLLRSLVRLLIFPSSPGPSVSWDLRLENLIQRSLDRVPRLPH